MVWIRGINTMATASSLDNYQSALLYDEPIGSAATLRRILCQVDFSMENTSGTWPDMPSVPVVLGLALTTNTTSGVTPPPPAAGPYTDEASWKVYWRGLIWRPNYIAPAGTSVFDAQDNIDNVINHLLPTTENNALYAGIEVLDNNGSGSTFFSSWSAIFYYNLLYTPQGS